jgi:adenylosuccinate synthase
MIKFADAIVDLQAGDTGKGKVAHALLESDTKYTHVIRYNGGGNAGHTIYHNNQKVVTHFIPCGVLYGIKSIIGLGCVVNVDKLFEEISYLEQLGFDVKKNLLIDNRVHIVTNEHLIEDSSDNKIGTTKQGIGPAYRDKYFRKGIRAESVEELRPYIFDLYSLHTTDEECALLFEGAQGFELDIDWGDYPYVTSSHCTIGSAILNGVPPRLIRKIFGVSKAYRTYVGAKNFEGDDLIFEKIRELGNEYGATTGRKRQINWFNLDDVIKAININGVTDIVINKTDILSQLDVFNLFHNSSLLNFNSFEEFQSYISQILNTKCVTLENITFSNNPHRI